MKKPRWTKSWTCMPAPTLYLRESVAMVHENLMQRIVNDPQWACVEGQKDNSRLDSAFFVVGRLGLLESQVVALLLDGEHGTNSKDTGNNSKGDANGPLELEANIGDELDGNEEKNHANGVVHVREISHELNDKGVEGSQAKNGTHAGSPHNNSVLSDAKDGGDGIHGEHDIGELDDDEHEHEWGELSLVDEISPMVATADRDDLLSKEHTGVVGEVLIIVVILANHQDLVGREDEDDRADEQKWAESVDDGGSSEHHQTAKDHSANDTPEEHTVLGSLGVYLEVLEDKVESKQIIE